MKFGKKIIPTFLILVFLLLGGLSVSVFNDLPDIHSIPDHLNQPSLRLADREGRLLYEILPQEGGRHAVLALANIPECMKQATIAVEDENFYANPGVDLAGILRAAWINLQDGETLAGGSTITQQVARNLLLADELSERTLRRKLRESVLAWQMARSYSKDEILALYLNQTFYGGFAYGVEAASQTYFGKPASALLLPECALLAGLPQAPALYNPFSDPAAAKARQSVVLGLMEKDGLISAAERQGAEQVPLSYNTAPFPIRAPHFAWMVKAQVDQLYASGRLDPQASLTIRTTLDLNAQEHAEAAVAHQIARFKDDGGLDHHVNNAAVVVLDAKNGEILALVGSADYFNAAIAGALNMATAPRQPGSAFKPFIYAAAFDPKQPAPWTAATPILDVETAFPTHDGVYLPQNYDDREHGPIPARVALASSLNIPAVAALQKVGVPAMTGLAARLGITSLGRPEDYDLSLALGGGQMSLLELTNAYAAFANGGYFPGHSAILDIRDADGKLLYTPEKPLQTQVFDPRVAWLISDILSDDTARRIGFGSNSTLKIDRPAAVKTGTTTNFHDNWTVGYTPANRAGQVPSLVVGVWVGNSDYQAMRQVNGLTGAAPIWAETLRALLQGQPEEPFQRPAGLTQTEVCAYSGRLPTPLCGQTHLEWFIDGTQPTQPDNVYRQIEIDPATGRLATAATPADRRQPLVVLDFPASLQRWAHAQGLKLLSDYSTPPAGAETAVLTITSPQPEAVYRLSDQTALASQQLPVEILAGPGLVQITLWVDGRQFQTLEAPPYRFWWPLAEGVHTFQARGVTAQGQPVTSTTVQITVTK
jgi:penicillin-binding protein 1C